MIFNLIIIELTKKLSDMDFGFGSDKKKKTGPSKKWTEKEIKDKIKEFDDKI